jgi:ribokinase
MSGVNVCIVGALHHEFLVRAPACPRPGETVIGESLALGVGGKGAQQAVAASRLGARVTLIGALGDDDQGRAVRAALASEGIDLAPVRTFDDLRTGTAVVIVSATGEKARLLVPGADLAMGPEDVERHSGAISDASVLLVQGELPIECTRRAIEIARKASTVVVLDASPAGELPEGLLGQVDVLVVSRSEAADLVGDRAREVTPPGLARRLASLGPERVVVSMGSDGALHFDGTELDHCDPFPAAGDDSTGAGDAFVGALGVFRGEGARLKDAVRLACAAGALATVRGSSLAAFPSREAVEELAENGRRRT